MDKAVPNSFWQGLAAAALEPGLRQVLLFDADSATLETAVSSLQQLLAITTEQQIQIIQLGGLVQEDDLWGSYIPSSTTNDAIGLSVVWQDGLLTQNRNDDNWLLVVIPDLTRLSLSASRACITLMDAPVAHLERYTQKADWQPRICWLAACPQDNVGRISSHLLDRFTLRLSTPPLPPTSSATAILEWLDEAETTTVSFAANADLPDKWRKKVTIQRPLPTLLPEAIQQVLSYSDGLMHQGLRRELALARLGRAMARLAEETAVTPHHIDEAADLIGLLFPQPTKEPDKPKPQQSDPELPQPQIEPQSDIPFEDEVISETDAPDSSEPSTIIESDESEIFPPTPMLGEPYPEDKASVDRELFALQLPLRHQQAANIEHGSIIGIQSADSLQDLALIPTFLEAALYQKIRRHPHKENGFILSPTDLRRHRRLPQPDKMLLLLLDYTSLRDCEWQQALIPHLHWAYVNRASITIVQVGASDTENELRAQKVAARSLLTPRIAEALEAQPGRATPLAHGLEMAYQVIQKAQEHGRSHIQETQFVIITDGRGNVPLAASASGQVKMPVNREGIEDALQAASHFHDLKHIWITLLDPQPQFLPELPLSFAEALGASRYKIPLVKEAQL